MRNKVVDYHPTLGNITFDDLIKYLDSILKEYKLLEDRIYYILKYNNYDDEIIASLLTNSIDYYLKYVSSILNSLL